MEGNTCMSQKHNFVGSIPTFYTNIITGHSLIWYGTAFGMQRLRVQILLPRLKSSNQKQSIFLFFITKTRASEPPMIEITGF